MAHQNVTFSLSDLPVFHSFSKNLRGETWRWCEETKNGNKKWNIFYIYFFCRYFLYRFQNLHADHLSLVYDSMQYIITCMILNFFSALFVICLLFYTCIISFSFYISGNFWILIICFTIKLGKWPQFQDLSFYRELFQLYNKIHIYHDSYYLFNISTVPYFKFHYLRQYT